MANQENQSKRATVETSQECPACGAAVRPRALFCHKCGRPVPELKEKSVVIEKNSESASGISSDWFAPTMQTQNLEIEQKPNPPIEENSYETLISPTTELTKTHVQDYLRDENTETDDETSNENLVKPTNEFLIKEKVFEPKNEFVEPSTEPSIGIREIVETEEKKEDTVLKVETQDGDFSQTSDVETELVSPVTQSQNVMEAEPEKKSVVDKPVFIEQKAKFEKPPAVENSVSPAKPKSATKPARRTAKQIEYVWEESNAPTFRFLLSAIILIALAAFILWTSYVLK
ncbi:MAG: zinc ribbon domain-containing protein [Pyrinomonadaceae bacterium]|nr:zinc ribbon domain-containing protein [Pyrinomonadaceae bacterium]